MKENLQKTVMDELYDRQSRENYLLNRVSDHKPANKAVNYPDAKLHQLTSFIKSAVRMIGYALIPFGFQFTDYGLELAAVVLIFSEVIGVIEELV